MTNQNKKHLEARSLDWLYLILGALVMAGLAFALVSTPQDIDYAGAQQDAPSSPGGGALALPPIVSQDPETTPEPEPDNTGTATDVPTPESPVIEIEEIDEAGEVEVVPVEDEFNLEDEVGTTQPVAPEPVRQTQDTTPVASAPTRTVRSGGLAIWLTILVVVLAGAGAYYYQTKGNRKASLKMSGKKGKMR